MIQQQEDGRLLDFFLITGIVIMGIGLACLIRPQAFSGTAGRRPGVSLLLAGLLAALGATLVPPHLAAAAATRQQLMAALDAAQPARQEVMARWDAAAAALPGGSVPARFLRWNTTDPLFGTNLNLIPAAAYTERLKPAEIVARSAAVPLDRLRDDPLAQIGNIVKVSGTVVNVSQLSLDTAIASILQRKDPSFRVISIMVSEARWVQFFTFDGPTDLKNGDQVTINGYMMGLVDPASKTPALFGKVIVRK